MAKGMARFLKNVYTKLNTTINIRVTVENRGSSILKKPQIITFIEDLEDAIFTLVREIEREGLDIEAGITIDPWQEVHASSKRPEEIFEKYEMLLEKKLILHDVHIHWQRHKIPTDDILDMFIDIIRKFARNQESTIFITPEILGGRKEVLENFLKKLEERITGIMNI